MTTKYFKTFTLSMLSLMMAACSPSESQIRKVLEEHPDMVTAAAEKDSKNFLNMLNKAAQAAQKGDEQRNQEQMKVSQDEEFRNPKKAEINDKMAAKGPKSAKVVIVEYTDFQCPFCRRGFDTMKQVGQAYPDQVRVVYKMAPLVQIHPHAMIAAKYFLAINVKNQAKALEFHDYVFEHQDEFTRDGEKFLKEASKKLGVNVSEKDLNSEAVQNRISDDQLEFQGLGFGGTPAYLVNGVSVRGAFPFDAFKSIIDRHLSK
jgi:protein-disulfide isomerase